MCARCIIIHNGAMENRRSSSSRSRLRAACARTTSRGRRYLLRNACAYTVPGRKHEPRRHRRPRRPPNAVSLTVDYFQTRCADGRGDKSQSDIPTPLTRHNLISPRRSRSSGGTGQTVCFRSSNFKTTGAGRKQTIPFYNYYALL